MHATVNISKTFIKVEMKASEASSNTIIAYKIQCAPVGKVAASASGKQC